MLDKLDKEEIITVYQTNDTLHNTEDIIEDKAREKLQKKHLLIRQYYDCIVLITDRKKIYKDIITADKILKAMKKSIVFGRVSSDDVVFVGNKYSNIAKYLWEKLGNICPSVVAGYSLKTWRALNDTFEDKKRLVNRRNTIVFIPSSEEAGQLAIAYKYLGRAAHVFSISPEKDSIEKLTSIKDLYSLFREKLKEETKQIIEEYNIKLIPYRPAYIGGKKITN